MRAAAAVPLPGYVTVRTETGAHDLGRIEFDAGQQSMACGEVLVRICSILDAEGLFPGIMACTMKLCNETGVELDPDGSLGAGSIVYLHSAKGNERKRVYAHTEAAFTTVVRYQDSKVGAPYAEEERERILWWICALFGLAPEEHEIVNIKDRALWAAQDHDVKLQLVHRAIAAEAVPEDSGGKVYVRVETDTGQQVVIEKESTNMTRADALLRACERLGLSAGDYEFNAKHSYFCVAGETLYLVKRNSGDHLRFLRESRTLSIPTIVGEAPVDAVGNASSSALFITVHGFDGMGMTDVTVLASGRSGARLFRDACTALGADDMSSTHELRDRHGFVHIWWRPGEVAYMVEKARK